jgi:ferredoxin-type protein NapG
MSDYSRREFFSLLRKKRSRAEQPAPPNTQQVRLPPPELLPPYLRPPGAGPENEFVMACTGCGACQKACPKNAILPLGEAYGDAKDTPCLLPSMEPCRLCEDMPCISACEPGALMRTPVDQLRMGTLKIRAEQCWAAQGQPCDYCVTACPLESPAIHFTGAEGRSLVVFDKERCIGCGLCLFYCTATPRAIEVERSFHDPEVTKPRKTSP